MLRKPDSTTSVVRESSAWIVVWCALAAIVIWYLHAELYTVYGPFLTLRDWGIPPPWAQLIRHSRWVARGVGALGLATLVFIEMKRQAVSQFIQAVISRTGFIVVSVVLIGCLSGVYFLLPGYLIAATDGIDYTTLAWQVRNALVLGRFPIWSNWGDMGSPLMQFFHPLLFTLVATVDLVADNIWVSMKLVLFTLHILSVAAVFVYVKRITVSRLGGIAAACAIGFCYYRYHLLVYTNKFVSAPTFLLLPLQLLLVEEIVVGSRARRAGMALAATVALGLIFHVHFGIHNVCFVSVYAVFRLFPVGSSPLFQWRRRTHAGRQLLLWTGLGVLASAAYTVPAVVEQDLTVIPDLFSRGLLSVPPRLVNDRIAAMFTFAGSQGRGWDYGYVGGWMMGFGLFGYALDLYKRNWRVIAPLSILVLALLLALGPVGFLFRTQGRYSVYVVVMGAIGVGVLVARLESTDVLGFTSWRGGWPCGRCGLVTLAICSIIIVDTLRFQLFLNYLVPPSHNGSPENRVTAHQWLARHRNSIQGRILDQAQPENGSLIPYVAGLSTYQGNNETSRWSLSLLRNLRPANPNPHGIRPYSLEELLGPERDLLLIANTGLVIADSPTPLAQYPGAVETGDGAVLIPTGGGMSMLASETTMIVEPRLQFAPLAREMSIDRESGVAAFIPILSGEGPSVHSALSGSVLTASVSNHSMESQYVRMDYELSSTAYLQLSYSYYPYLRVKIDGAEVETFPTAFGLIGLQSPSGGHTLEIIPYLSPLRRVVIAINMAALLLLAVLWLLSFRRLPAPRAV